MPLKVQKESDSIKLSLKKNGLDGIKINVEFFGDVSGSMKGCYDKDKPMDIAMQKLLVFASIVDPDHELVVHSFSDTFNTIGTFSVDDYESIHSHFSSNLRGGNLWQGTIYNCALSTLLTVKPSTKIVTTTEVKPSKSFFKRLLGGTETVVKSTVVQDDTVVKSNDEPKLIFFTTDGEDNGSHDELYQTLQSIVDNTNIFVMFIGIGKSARKTLTKIDNDFEGIGTLLVDDIVKLADDDFCDSIITEEFKDWYTSVTQQINK
jgi:hypothetical protein